jgi:dipicolinate synthase subunit B
MAAKASLRNGIPVVILLSTNDGLAGSAKNLGLLLNVKNVYFVPLKQDDPNGKPTSLVADFGKIEETINFALQGKQIQPAIF